MLSFYPELQYCLGGEQNGGRLQPHQTHQLQQPEVLQDTLHQAGRQQQQQQQGKLCMTVQQQQLGRIHFNRQDDNNNKREVGYP